MHFLLALMLALPTAGCLSARTYYGPSRLSSPPPVELEVFPLISENGGHLLGRFTLTSRLPDRRSLCIGMPWKVSVSYQGGAAEAYEVDAVEEGLCTAEAVTLEAGKTASWVGPLLHGTKGVVSSLALTVRVYAFAEHTRPRRREFYTVSTLWSGGT
jgi:hypothetical protein